MDPILSFSHFNPSSLKRLLANCSSNNDVFLLPLLNYTREGIFKSVNWRFAWHYFLCLIQLCYPHCMLICLSILRFLLQFSLISNKIYLLLYTLSYYYIIFCSRQGCPFTFFPLSKYKYSFFYSDKCIW